ncbi:MAG: lysophospholipid acyltransferase family protein [Chloroflexota bacterium]
MKNIDISEILRQKSPALFSNYPSFVSKGLVNFLDLLFHTRQINHVLKEFAAEKNFDFIDSLFNYLDFSYELSKEDKLRIPAEGKLVVVANHPLGGLDGLALLRALGEVRSDVKVVANDVLSHIENIRDLLLPYDVLSVSAQRKNLERIEASLAADEAILFFPAAEVSRLGWSGVQDRKWLKGAVKYASKLNAPVLPVYVDGQNSALFYLLSLLYRRFGMFLLPHELFNKKGESLKLHAGNPIPASAFTRSGLNERHLTNLLKKHVYRIGAGKPGIFHTETTIIRPTPKELLVNDLSRSELLGQTADGKKIYLCAHDSAPNVLREISRLREITFRSVGEGAGKEADSDKYDRYYDHIALWDDRLQEIMGSYRLCLVRDVIENKGVAGLYNASMFAFGPDFNPIFDQAIELGRSFIQQKYWKSSALDYIWQGIGAYIQKRPNVKYLLGAVSVSDSYTTYAKNLIVYYYKKWYGIELNGVKSLTPYVISAKEERDLSSIFAGKSRQEDFNALKSALKELGFTVPALYRKYVELCEYGGANFIDFAVNVNFMNSLDGLLLLDLTRMRETSRHRYFGQRSFLDPSRN